jgi:hypothetical protein
MTTMNGQKAKAAGTENGTPVYARQHKRGLTLAQLNAVDLLAAGKNDTETAKKLKLSRTCITKWRLYDPVFQAALNVRRAEVWGVGIDRLRSLIPKALDALAEELDWAENPNRWRVAAEIVKLAQLPGAAPHGPIDPDAIVRAIVERKRSQARGVLEDFAEEGKGLPGFEKHLAQTWQELEALAAEPDGPRPDDPNNSEVVQ